LARGPSSLPRSWTVPLCAGGYLADQAIPRRSPGRKHTWLEALRSGGLCCPRRSSLVRPPPTSARRPPRFPAPAGYRIGCCRAPQGGGPRPLCRRRDGSLLFREGLCNRSTPTPPAGSWALRFQVLRAVHWPSPPCAGLGSRLPRLRGRR
jgi:hypothetical protein